MHNPTAQAAAQLSARWPGWSVWWVPRATGKPVVTWHARRRDGTGEVIHAETAGELDGAIGQAEGN
jgi:hypothetical protein